MQATINEMTTAQTRIQEELQIFKAQPTHSEQNMQIAALVFMFVGAALYLTRDVRPFLMQYTQVCSRHACSVYAHSLLHIVLDA